MNIHADLGKNFQQKVMPLNLSAKNRINGAEKENPEIDDMLKSTVMIRDKFCCQYCGFQSENNLIHHLDDNHLHNDIENLAVIDPLCHYWQHLELMKDRAVIAYLPELSGRAVNHLQRTISHVLKTGNKQEQSEARKVIDWLVSHKVYTEQAFNTSSPYDFADVLTSVEQQYKNNRIFVFSELALVFTDYDLFDQLMLNVPPISEWNKIYTHFLLSNPI